MEELIKILYVDDESDLLHIGKQFLENFRDFFVTTATSSADAIELLQQQSFDLIISDYQMPRMDGIEFLKYLRSIGDATPFILFTGKGREEVVIEALNNGADFYLQKGGEPMAQFAELANTARHTVSRRRAEHELQETQKQMSQIIDFLPDATFAINNGGIVIAWNQAMEEMTGIKKENMIGQGDHAYTIPFYGERRKQLLDLLDIDDTELALRYNQIQRIGHSLSAEVFTPALYNGKGAYVWAIGSPLFDMNGNRVGAIESIRDVTNRTEIEEEIRRKNITLQTLNEKLESSQLELETNFELLYRQEKELKQIKEKFEALYYHMIEGAALCELIFNQDGNPEDYCLIEINPAYEKQLGLAREQLIGKTSREVFGISDPPYLDIFARVALTGKSDTFETYFSPIGKYFAISVYCPYSGSFAIIFEDITEKKRAEISLRETNEFLESLITIANVPIIVWDTSLYIIRINHAFELLIGRNGEEVIGTPLHLLFPPEQAEQSIRLLKSTLDGVRWDTTEFDIMHKDGSIRTLLWNSATLYSEDGKTPIATIAQGHDITRERRLERERNSAISQIKQNIAILAILNDEIRNPLSIILTYTELITDQKAAEEISKQIDRIDQMVSQVDKSWIESEKIFEYLRKHHQITVNKPSNLYDPLFDYSNDTVQPFVTDEKRKSLLIEEIQAQLYTILDSLDALVYVTDMDTYELLYTNQKGRNIFGNVIGKKCYLFFNHGNDEPCPFCTNHILREQLSISDVYHWVYQNPLNGRWYDCRDRVIRWTDGRLVRLEIATDITKQKKLEKNLIQERSLLNQAEHIAHMGSWRIILKTGEISWSDEMFNIFGFKKQNFSPDLDEIIRLYVYPDDQSKVRNFFLTIKKGGVPQDFEYRIIKPDGSHIWVYSLCEQEFDKAGNLVSITGFLEDITERKIAELRISDSEKKFLTVFKENPVSLTLVSLYSGIFTDVNDAFLQNCGFSREEIVGKTAKEVGLFPYDQEYQQFVTQLRKDHVVTDMDLHCLIHNGEILICRLSSKIMTIEGTPHILTAVINITEEKQAEILLQESELKYRVISEISTDFQFSCIKDLFPQYKIDWMTGSVERITGYSISELKEMGCWGGIVHPDDRLIFDKNVTGVLPGQISKCSLRIITKMGEIRWLSVHTTQISILDSSSPERLFGGCRDITDYKLLKKTVEN